MDRPQQAMIVTPHPDDVEIGCGGKVARWIACGTDVVYVLCTNRDKGTEDKNLTSHRLAEIPEIDQLEATSELGIKKVECSRHTDEEFEAKKEFRGEIVGAIRQYEPEVVLSPDHFRREFYLHRDDKLFRQVTTDATYPDARDHLYAEHATGGLNTHKVRDILLWGLEVSDTFWTSLTLLIVKSPHLKNTRRNLRRKVTMMLAHS